jgi:hypothetical protein
VFGGCGSQGYRSRRAANIYPWITASMDASLKSRLRGMKANRKADGPLIVSLLGNQLTGQDIELMFGYVGVGRVQWELK